MSKPERDVLEEYIRQTRQTAPEQDSVRDLLQATLGLPAERLEKRRALDAEERAEEWGDSFWYAARMIDAIRELYDVEPLDHLEGGACQITISYGETCDSLKSLEFQQTCEAEEVARKAGKLLHSMWQAAPDPERILHLNIRDLQERYPEGFETGGGNRD